MNIDEMIAVLQAAKDGKTIQLSGDRVWWNDMECVQHAAWNFDKFMYRVKPVKRVMYLNIYDDIGVMYGHLSAAEADKGAAGERFARVRVVYEEGQLDA